jgi:cytochrome c-type biogenesis protein CcmH/NrfG
MSRLDPVPKVSGHHDTLYTAGSKLIWPHLEFADQPPKVLSLKAQEHVRDGIAKLKMALGVRPSNSKNWSTFWLLGKAYEALGDSENSYRCFRSAFEINPKHVDVARELMASSLRTERTNEALSAAKTARDLAPSNPGVIANLALALFRSGQLDEALSTGREALQLAPSNSITQSLVAKIEEAAARSAPAPTTAACSTPSQLSTAPPA